MCKERFLSYPYVLDITTALQKGENQLTFILSTALALQEKDHFSKFCRMDKCGLNAKIRLYEEKNENV